MERVAVVTDIHANLAALDAALDAIRREGVEAVCCGGDLVGYGPRPNEVCSLIEERGIPTIYGNYDWAIARDEEDCRCAYVTEHDREIGQLSVDWTLANTDARSKDFMRALPFDLRFELGGKRVRLVHGSPRKVNEYLFEDKPAKTFERIAAGADCDILVFGHTHKPWVREYGGVLFVNCGSVGKPKDGDPRGAFALLAADNGDVRVDIPRVEYSAAQVAREMRREGLPGELADNLVGAR
jgi:putative phosphoesterase